MEDDSITAVLSCPFIFGCYSCRAQEGSESARKIVNRVVPQYPRIARTMSLQGNVKVEAVVASDGSVEKVEIKGGHPVLVQAAQEAIRNWKWAPAPKESRELMEIKFNP